MWRRWAAPVAGALACAGGAARGTCLPARCACAFTSRATNLPASRLLTLPAALQRAAPIGEGRFFDGPVAGRPPGAMGRGGHPDHLSETAAPRCALIQGHNAATARRGTACNTPKAPPHLVRLGAGLNPGPPARRHSSALWPTLGWRTAALIWRRKRAVEGKAWGARLRLPRPPQQPPSPQRPPGPPTRPPAIL